MPPQYWAGRFMALHDRFHNELLEPHHLTRLCEAQAAQPLPDFTRQVSAAAQNNPSTSAYALTRAAQASKQPHGQNGVSRQPSRSRIPQSATSGAILQSTSYNTQSSVPFYSQAGSSSNKTATLAVTGNSHLPTTDENSIPEYPPSIFASQTDTPTSPNRNMNHNLSHNQNANHTHNLNHQPNHLPHPPIPNPTTNPLTTTTTLPNPPALPTTGASMSTSTSINKNRRTTTTTTTAPLTDDEASRTRRVLLHLEYLCTSDAALSSLRQWQAGCARKTGRGEFLPPLLSPIPTFGSSAGAAASAGGGGGGGGGAATGRGIGGKGGGATAMTAGSKRGRSGEKLGGGLYAGGGGGGGRRNKSKSLGVVGDGEKGERRTEEKKGQEGMGMGKDGPRGGENHHQGAQDQVGTGGGETQNGHTHGHHEFGRRGREMMKRLKRSLVGGGDVSGGGDKTVDWEREMFGDRHESGIGRANGEPGEGYLADLEGLAVDEKEKGRRGGRRFSFF